MRFYLSHSIHMYIGRIQSLFHFFRNIACLTQSISTYTFQKNFDCVRRIIYISYPCAITKINPENKQMKSQSKFAIAIHVLAVYRPIQSV